ncbi:Cell wall-associated hydrolase, NlpC family [Pricia antarctica]|uniref:Cell wall-associated hydrolase, NlpC family n=1 Tax=Pricia antarctica TaxID=641691 RepID=A0A1G6VVE6_9FLAO|nr:C40 family peptidase [Pricia antarctica]SDD57528.1 Cell wall-associated hydrolase, NlpC family [Pricia antarctica]
MLRKFLYIFLLLLITACGAKKKTTANKTRTVSVASTKENRPKAHSAPPSRTSTTKRTKADYIIDTALEFSGVRYKYGGTTKKGMDCSGLLYVAFAENNVKLPRASYHMAEEGRRIDLRDVTKGDLLFFRTTKGAKRINHVGMVVTVERGEIKFIHSSSSRGVIVSSLREGYWNSTFVRAKRVL